MNKLALLGGSPLSQTPSTFTWPPRDYSAGSLVKEYLDQGLPLSIPGRSGIILSCEEALASTFQTKHALLCSSGTMALYSAYFAMGIQPGDEIICTNITYQATATPALHLGAKVILADVEADTGNISLDDLLNKITTNTRCVATNAMWGHAVDQDRLREICDQRGILWLEDVSHAQLASYKGRPLGSFGDIACASLQGPKLISGGEAGVLLTSNSTFYEQAILLGHNLKRSQQMVDLKTNHHFADLGRTGYGLKLRCHPLAALIIEDQLVNHATTWVSEREQSLNQLSKTLGQLEHIRPPLVKDEVTSMGAWYGYKPWVNFETLGISRKRLVEALQAEGLDVKAPRSDALNNLAIFDTQRFPISGFEKHDNSQYCFPNTEAYQAGLLSLPTPTGQRDTETLNLLINGFQKVWNQLDNLRSCPQ